MTEGQRQRPGNDDGPKRLETIVLFLVLIRPAWSFSRGLAARCRNYHESYRKWWLIAQHRFTSLYPSGVSLSSAVLQRPVSLTCGAPASVFVFLPAHAGHISARQGLVDSLLAAKRLARYSVCARAGCGCVRYR